MGALALGAGGAAADANAVVGGQFLNNGLAAHKGGHANIDDIGRGLVAAVKGQTGDLCQPFLRISVQFFDGGVLRTQIRQCRYRSAKPGDQGRCLRTRTQFFLLLAAKSAGQNTHALAHIQSAYSLGTVDLVGGDGH